MRAILAFIIAATAATALGGCLFHQQKAYVAEAPPAPPPVYKPLK